MSSIQTRMMGHVVEAEVQPYLVNSGPYNLPHGGHTEMNVSSFGWGKQFSFPLVPAAAFICWFHFPVPAPQLLNGSRLFLDSVSFFFNSDNVIAINEIHLWDGSTRVWEHSMPEMFGDWRNPRTINVQGRFAGNNLNPRQMRGTAIGDRIEFNNGLGISLRAFVSNIGQITFHSAGAAWVDAAR